jgi:hypothetical protein
MCVRPIHLVCVDILPQRVLQHYETKSFGIIYDLGIADILQDNPDGLHINELARCCKVDPQKLVHIMRLMAAEGTFTEGALHLTHEVFLNDIIFPHLVKPDVFASNRLSLPLLSLNPVSDLVGLCIEDLWLGMDTLLMTMKDPEFSFAQTPQKSAIMLAMRDKMKLKESDTVFNLRALQVRAC